VVRSPGEIEVLSEMMPDPIARAYSAPTRWVKTLSSGESTCFSDLPPGEYRVVCWNDRLPGSQQPVTLTAGARNAGDSDSERQCAARSSVTKRRASSIENRHKRLGNQPRRVRRYSDDPDSLRTNEESGSSGVPSEPGVTGMQQSRRGFESCGRRRLRHSNRHLAHANTRCMKHPRSRSPGRRP